MLKRPPQHRVDATPVYVDERDTAWDVVRIKAECAEMRKAGQDPRRHPVNVYHSGESRYDLGASYAVLGTMHSAAEYLGANATRFVLRTLEHPEYYRVVDLWGRTEAQLLACRLALMSVENNNELKIERDDQGVTYESMELLASVEWLPFRIGMAAYQASKPLSESEKKV